MRTSRRAPSPAVEHYESCYRRSGAAVRLPSLSRLRRVRIAARDEGADRARSRATRTAGQHQARPGRHSRDRVHRAGVPAAAWRERSAAAVAIAARGAAACSPGRSCCRRKRSPSCEASVSVPARLENRLQMLNDEQIHTLPEEPDIPRAAALAMGAESWEALCAELQTTSRAVTRQFQLLLSAPASATSSPRRRGSWRPCSRAMRHRRACRRASRSLAVGCRVAGSATRRMAPVPGGATPGRDRAPAPASPDAAPAGRAKDTTPIHSRRSVGRCASWRRSARAAPISHCSTRMRRRCARLVQICARSEFLTAQIAAFRCCSMSWSTSACSRSCRRREQFAEEIRRAARARAGFGPGATRSRHCASFSARPCFAWRLRI